MRKPKFYYYNKEICKQASLEYKNRRDFYKFNSAAANAALINGWIDEFFPPLKNHYGYWTYETCKKEALKYHSKKEFKENCETAYKVVLRKKWFELIEHFKILGNHKKRLIYAQEFSDNCVYIGLTYNINKRCKNHLTRKKETVYKHMVKTKLQPTLKILTDFFYIEDAIKNEQKWIEIYKNNGWNILNIAKAGGVGGNIIKWDTEALIKESSKYNNKKEFREKSYNAYCAVHRNKVSKDVMYNMKSVYHTVGQFTLDNQFIKSYETTGFASKETGIKQSSISSCCNKKYKSAGGFLWKYL